MSSELVSFNYRNTNVQLATIRRPSKMRNWVLYWPLYKAQLTLHSPILANTSVEGYSLKKYIYIYFGLVFLAYRPKFFSFLNFSWIWHPKNISALTVSLT